LESVSEQGYILILLGIILIRQLKKWCLVLISGEINCLMSTKIDLKWGLMLDYDDDGGAFTKTRLLISITIKTHVKDKLEALKFKREYHRAFFCIYKMFGFHSLLWVLETKKILIRLA